MFLDSRKSVWVRVCLCCTGVVLALRPQLHAAPQTMAVVGDSISEGVQSANVDFRTQAAMYSRLIAARAGVRHVVPWLYTGPFGVLYQMPTRGRIFPGWAPTNLGVGGATAHDALYARADAATRSEINDELDLVLYPWQGSQVDVVEQMEPDLVLCWIGNNDVLDAILSFQDYDGTQMTPVGSFAADFEVLAARLTQASQRVVFANIPDITHAAFLMSPSDLRHFVGADFGLPAGSRTSLPAMMLIRLGRADGSLLADPAYVLDAGELQAIRNRIGALNAVIADIAGRYGCPVVDMHTRVNDLIAAPPSFGGVPLRRRFLGGLFSLDGVHPCNTGHALIADAFIDALNAAYGMGIRGYTDRELERVFLYDPEVDKDGDGRARGRFGAGMLETLGPLLGISGDTNEGRAGRRVTKLSARQQKRVLRALLGRQAAAKAGLADVQAALARTLGLD